MPVTGEINICEIPSLILAYITVHYTCSAVFQVTLQIIGFYVSRKALKAVSMIDHTVISYHIYHNSKY